MYPGKDFDEKWQELVFPANYKNPQPKDRYHLVVIGAGPAGLITAIAAAGLGAKVALIERHAMGGDCLNVGCVPSKAIISRAKKSHLDSVSPDSQTFDNAMSWLRKVRADISDHDSVARYNESGVDVFLGDAKYVDDTHIAVGDCVLNTKKSVICTGARASIIPFPGLVETGYLTNENVFDIKERPESLAIIGAGAIGCELAQAFSRLGTKVYLLDAAPRVLPREEPEASDILDNVLAVEGVSVITGTMIESINVADDKKVVNLPDDQKVTVDEIVVALGRAPNIEGLNLEKVGVKTERIVGIVVNDRLQTANPKIYAAGDVCSPYKFTHSADAQARIVVQNTLFKGRAKTKGLIIPWCTYTDPEIAHVGLTKEQADQQGIKYEVISIPWADLDRSQTDAKTTGYAEVLLKKDKIIGCTIVGDNAGEMLAPIVVLMSNKLGIGALGKSIMPYPTRSEYLRRIADTYNRKKLTPFVKMVFKLWLKITG